MRGRDEQANAGIMNNSGGGGGVWGTQGDKRPRS